MAWEILARREVAEFGNIDETSLRDAWYDIALSLVKKHTGWGNFVSTTSYTETHHGDNSTILRLNNPPIISVTSVTIDGTVIDADLYSNNETSIYFKNRESLGNFTVESDNPYFFDLNFFPKGLGNIVVVYDGGGIASNKFQLARGAMLLIITEFALVPKHEGTDAGLQVYRPDRTLLPEEVLVQYGLHGKVSGILRTLLPKRLLMR